VIAPTLFALVLEIVDENRRKSPLWRRGVLIFGVLLSTLTWWQLSRQDAIAAAERDKATHTQEDLKGKLDQSLNSQQHMQGQLEALGTMMTRLAANGSNPALKQLAAAVDDLVKANQKQNQNFTLDLELLSLRQELLNGAKELRTALAFYFKVLQESPGVVPYSAQTKEGAYVDLQRAFKQANNLKERALRVVPRTEDDDKSTSLFNSFPGGLDEAALYLERLADRLPH